MKNRHFTIVLPVRNGGEHLKECVQSILAQNYEYFDLAVLENHSTDGSYEWLQTVQDPRIKIYPSACDLSIEDNWARTSSIPRQEFMTFIGHDDLLAPDFLFVVNQLIDRHPDASLYQTHFTRIDAAGNIVGQNESIPESENVEGFLKGLLLYQRYSYSGFIMRTLDYDKVGGFPNNAHLLWADVELWLRLSAISYKASASEPLFLLRIYPESVSASSNREIILIAMKKFNHFLLDFQQEHHELIPVTQEHAPSYFLPYIDSIRERYMRELVEATKHNRKVDTKLFLSIEQDIKEVTLSKAATVANTRALRWRIRVNNNFALRAIYITYIRIRYGSAGLSLR